MKVPLDSLCRYPRRLDGGLRQTKTNHPQLPFGCFSRPEAAGSPSRICVPFARCYVRLH